MSDPVVQSSFPVRGSLAWFYGKLAWRIGCRCYCGLCPSGIACQCDDYRCGDGRRSWRAQQIIWRKGWG